MKRYGLLTRPLQTIEVHPFLSETDRAAVIRALRGEGLELGPAPVHDPGPEYTLHVSYGVVGECCTVNATAKEGK